MKTTECRVLSGDSLPPTPSKIPLATAEEIRRELAGVYRDMRRGVIEAQAGTRLAYVLDLLRRAYETETLQRRMELLERALTMGKQGE